MTARKKQQNTSRNDKMLAKKLLKFRFIWILHAHLDHHGILPTIIYGIFKTGEEERYHQQQHKISAMLFLRQSKCILK